MDTAFWPVMRPTTVSRLHLARHGLAVAILVSPGCQGSDWQSTVDGVIAAERAFAARASDTTVQQAFLEAMATDALLFRPGPADARTALSSRPYPSDLALEWTPQWADASQHGELGYTTGPWSSGRRSGNDEPAGHGTYITIWKRLPREGWRVILDFGTAGAPRTAVADARNPPSPPHPAEAADSNALAESIRLVDEDFRDAVVADSNALLAFVADDTRFLRDGSAATIGTRVASDAYAGVERRARWVLSGSDVSRVGDLGFVFGTWTSIAPDTARGAWLRIWRRDPAGDWKLALDAVTGSRSAPIL